MPSTETTSLTGDKPTRVYYARDALPFYSQRRKQRLRLRCLAYGIVVAIFTMALIVTVSYSVSHDIIDQSPNLTSQESPTFLNLTRSLKLGFAPDSGSYTLFSNPSGISAKNSILVPEENPNARSLTESEIREGLEAGRQAINERLFADATALMSPMANPSPESRHRYAVRTCPGVAALALAATAELAATKKIENSRKTLGSSSAIGSFFDGGWQSFGVCEQSIKPDCPSIKYRTFDGSCNRATEWGTSMTPFRRILSPSYADGVEEPRRAISGSGLPSAREVSLKVHKPSPSSNPRFTVMLAVYGQFLDHDITATAISQGIDGSSISCCPPAVGHPECFSVPVSSGDPVFDATGRTCMDFVRSAPAPQCKLGPRQQLNQVSAFIDGSAIYGSDVRAAGDLREYTGGRLRMQRTPDNRTLLPASTDPNDGCNRETEKLRGRYCFAAGDARANENLHLTTMHLLWARQHNRITEELAAINPFWDDETLYQESRRIVGAQLQHITYNEFLPIILGQQETDLRDLKPLRFAYRKWPDDSKDPNTDPSIANSFAAAAFRFAHTLLPGLMKITEEGQGTSSYVELHRMLFNPYSLYAEDGVKNSVNSAIGNTIQKTSTHVTSQLTNHLFEDPIANFSVPCGLDLVSLNIQRGRDHGLPGYTKWREYCGLGKVNSFYDLIGHLDLQALQEIAKLYESVHDVDLYTAALAELPKAGAIVGPTFTCLIAEQFVRLQRGDRFWYETGGQPHSFDEDQLTELRKTSLARIICDCSDGVTQTQAEVMRTIGPDNPMISCEDVPMPSFEPWKEIKTSSPVLRDPFVPLNWTTLKDNINNTIQDVVNYINNTRASVTMDTDWIAFKNYVNDTFSDLRNQLSNLHSEVKTMPKEQFSMDTDTFILRSTEPTNVYQDWSIFKNNLMKYLNNSMETMGGDSTTTEKWLSFKKNVSDQFSKLKDQISSIKSDVGPKLKMTKDGHASIDEIKLTEMRKVNNLKLIPAIFDWKNFKDNIISSLNGTIVDLENNMPPPGDPSWATFGTDFGKRFSNFRDKVDGQRSTASPTEFLAGKLDMSDDWLAYKTEVIKTVNDAVDKIKNGMPQPGDPAWAAYRDKVAKSFSVFQSTSSPLEFATLSDNSDVSLAGKLKTKSWSNMTDDWFKFRAGINDSLIKATQDIDKKKTGTIDPFAWSVFKDSIANDFAKLKDEIVSLKMEWLAEITKEKPDEKTPSLHVSFKKSSNFSNFDYSKFIPPNEWIDFKKEINNTIMNILNSMNSTDSVDLEDLQGMFNKSFVDLKDEISSLRSIIANTYNNRTAADWISFQLQLNSSVKDLVQDLKKEDQASSGNLMKILIKSRDKISDIQFPTELFNTPSTEWMTYASTMNKTILDTLNNIDTQKYQPLTLKAEEPSSSSSWNNSNKFTDWLTILCLTFTTISRFQGFV